MTGPQTLLVCALALVCGGFALAGYLVTREPRPRRRRWDRGGRR